jgi:hypothetical protein
MRISCPKTNDGKHYEEVDVSHIDMHAISNMDDKQFTLSAFGLPEPAAKAKPSTVVEHRIWIMYCTVGLALLVAAFFVKRAVQRRAAGGP